MVKKTSVAVGEAIGMFPRLSGSPRRSRASRTHQRPPFHAPGAGAMRLTCRGARPMPLLLVPLLFLVVLSGCIARPAAEIVTLPITAAGPGVGGVTTLTDEHDRNRGGEIPRTAERAHRERGQPATHAK